MTDNERPTWDRYNDSDWTSASADAQKIEDWKRARASNASLTRLDAQIADDIDERIISRRANGSEKNPSDWTKG